MENASKALMIAGGVLIAILIATIWVYLFNKMGSGVADVYDTIEQSDISEFNQRFLNYEGRGVFEVPTGEKDESGNEIKKKNPLKPQDIETLINLAIDAERNSKVSGKVEIKIDNLIVNLDQYKNNKTKTWLQDNAYEEPQLYMCTEVNIDPKTLLVNEVLIKKYN